MHYIERHDKIAANTLEIYKEYTLVRDQKLYEHFPDTVVHNDTVAVHWNTPCHSGRYIKENRTDTDAEPSSSRMPIDGCCCTVSEECVIEEKVNEYKEIARIRG